MSDARRTCAIVDAHVHLHGCYEPDAFFDHAYANLTAAAERFHSPPGRAVLPADDGVRGRRLFRPAACTPAEMAIMGRGGWLKQLVHLAHRRAGSPRGAEERPPHQRHRGAAGAVSRRAGSADSRHDEALPGRPVDPRRARARGFAQRAARDSRGAGQVVLPARPPAQRVAARVPQADAVPGDEGGRPGFWPYPSHFREGAALGVRDLPGTDPAALRARRRERSAKSACASRSSSTSASRCRA